MTYSASEISAHDGQPVECFEFVGTYLSYLYTSGDQDIVVDSKEFKAIPMSRGGIKLSVPTDSGAELQVDLPADLDIVREYAFQITPPNLYLTIYRFHRGADTETEFAIYWQGPISTIEVIDGKRAEVRAESELFSILNSNLPSVFYQSPCNHVLFGEGCGVSRAANSVATTVLAQTGSLLTVASDGGFPANFFNGGEVLDVESGERRMVISQLLMDLTINFPFSINLVGRQVELTAGCDHAWKGDCKNKFSNTERFGGMPLIPAINAFNEGF